jgi:hypothetical protein
MSRSLQEVYSRFALLHPRPGNERGMGKNFSPLGRNGLFQDHQLANYITFLSKACCSETPNTCCLLNGQSSPLGVKQAKEFH